MNRIEGRTAIITGGSRGIGFAIAEALLERGSRVFICARNEGEVQKSVAALKNKPGREIHGAACDVRSYDSVSNLFSRANDIFGGLDILVNNAGIGSRSYVEQTTIEEWNATIETNLTGVFHCCHAALPLMKARGGYIINIASLAGKYAHPGSAAYNASKFGLVGFSEALMQEVRYDH